MMMNLINSFKSRKISFILIGVFILSAFAVRAFHNYKKLSGYESTAELLLSDFDGMNVSISKLKSASDLILKFRYQHFEKKNQIKEKEFFFPESVSILVQIQDQKTNLFVVPNRDVAETRIYSSLYIKGQPRMAVFKYSPAQKEFFLEK